MNLSDREREAKLQAIGGVLEELLGPLPNRVRKIEEKFLKAIEQVELDFEVPSYEARLANSN